VVSRDPDFCATAALPSPRENYLNVIDGLNKRKIGHLLFHFKRSNLCLATPIPFNGDGPSGLGNHLFHYDGIFAPRLSDHRGDVEGNTCGNSAVFVHPQMTRTPLAGTKYLLFRDSPSFFSTTSSA